MNIDNFAIVLKKKLSSKLLRNQASMLFMLIGEVKAMIYKCSWDSCL